MAHIPSPSTTSETIRDASADLMGSISALVRNVTEHAMRLSNHVVRDAAAIGRDSERLAAAARLQYEGWQQAGRAAPRVARVVAEGASLLALYRWHLLRAKIGGFDRIPDDAHRA